MYTAKRPCHYAQLEYNTRAFHAVNNLGLASRDFRSAGYVSARDFQFRLGWVYEVSKLRGRGTKVTNRHRVGATCVERESITRVSDKDRRQ